jgi:hypothetical protein
MKMFFLFVLFFFFSPLLFAQDWNPQERITDFQSRLLVNKDASLTVTENISVYAHGEALQHGLVRSLPTTYTDSYGITHHTRYDIKEIKVNGQPSPYHLANEDNNLVIYIGDKYRLLSHGFYTYTLQYQVNHAINFLADADELYWNITGNHWSFPILRASASLQLPEGANILYHDAYTGHIGDREKNYSVSYANAPNIIFSTTKALPPGAGLTIAVTWPKGFIQAPTRLDQIRPLFQIGPEEKLVFSLALIIFCYYFLAWYLVGQGPKKGTIIPLFEPPGDLTPAAMRFIYQMGADSKDFASAIVSMATKGYLTIYYANKVVTLIQQQKDVDKLPDHERDTFNILFEKTSSLDLEKSNLAIIRKAQTKLFAGLVKAYKKPNFFSNTGYWMVGAFLSVMATFVLIVNAKNNDAASTLLYLAMLTLFTTVFLPSAWRRIKTLSKSISYYNLQRAFSRCIFVGIAGGFIVSILFTSQAISIITMLLYVLMVTINLIFVYLLKGYTPNGRKLMDQIEGFRLFLSATERYRLDQLNPPDKTPQLFETYLPYAMALDVENEWGQQFTGVLKQATTEEESSSYQPSWYRGSAWNANSFATFPLLLNDSLTSAISSSSSASSGGGSSGGGGGGGGGGGW